LFQVVLMDESRGRRLVHLGRVNVKTSVYDSGRLLLTASAGTMGNCCFACRKSMETDELGLHPRWKPCAVRIPKHNRQVFVIDQTFEAPPIVR
jgi:hypothetical protein